jgi:hypothetical protein
MTRAQFWFAYAVAGLASALAACSSDNAPQTGGRTVADAASAELPGPACPGATDERCNGVDDDCDGLIDEAAVDARPVYPDRDGDGFGAPDSVFRACAAGEGLTFDSTDCDDSNPAVYPGAPEVCNERDDDCSGQADDGELSVVYQDFDEDGVGTSACFLDACVDVPGFVTSDGDCDDEDPAVGRGDACAVPTGTRATPVFEDRDRDGYGAGPVVTYTCTAVPGLAPNARDCDDTDPRVRPGALDACDQVDQDCNGSDNCSGWEDVPSIADVATPIIVGGIGERVGQWLFVVGDDPVRVAAPAWRVAGCETYLVAFVDGRLDDTRSSVCMDSGAAASGALALWRTSGLDVTRSDAESARTSAIAPMLTSLGSVWRVHVAGEAPLDGAVHVWAATQREPFTSEGPAELHAARTEAVGGDSTVWIRLRTLDGDEPRASLLDLDADGIDDLVVATPDADQIQGWSGPLTRAGLEAPPTWTWSGESLTRFGEAVALGDVDADGQHELLVGAPDGGVQGGGQAVALPLEPGTWSIDDARVRVDGDEPGARFGAAVAFDDDAQAWVVASPGRRAGGASNGALWVFDAGPSPRLDAPAARIVGDGDRAQLGTTLASTRVDGRVAILVGAPGAVTGSGTVYALDLAAVVSR